MVAPQNLQATAYVDRVELSFESTTDSTFTMIIQRRREGETFGTLEHLDGNARAYADTTCIARNQWCEYTVQAVRSDCQTPTSEAVRAYTLPNAPSDAQAQLAVGQATADVALTWSDTNLALSDYVVSRLDADCLNVQATVTLAAGVTRWDDSGIALDTVFCYSIAARNTTGDSEAVTVLAGPAPAPPSNLSAATCGPECIHLTWTDRSTTNTAYRLERAAGASDAYVELEGSPLPASATSFTDTAGLAPGVMYLYRVTTVGTAVESVASTTGATSAHPSLAWGGAPSLAGACELSVPGTATLDTAHGAVFESGAESYISKASSVIATASGVQGTLTDLLPGVFTTRWTVTDSLGGTSTLERALALDFDPSTTVYTTDVALPVAALGRDGMVGRQVWFLPDPTISYATDCHGCVGNRGSLAMGAYFGFVLTANEQLVAFGHRDFGMLADGTPSTVSGAGARLHPVPVCASGAIDNGDCAPLSGVLAVTSGGMHSCALLESGRIQCWGHNTYGQLGDGGLTGNGRDHPTTVCTSGSDATCVPLENAVAVTTGYFHTCALLNDGTARCFGRQDDGRLGNGVTGPGGFPNPVTVCASGSGSACPALGSLVSISAGEAHTCALTSTGGIVCWGRNTAGELGDGTTTNRAIPVPVCASGMTGGGCVALTGVKAVSAGSHSTCVVVGEFGDVQCWGDQTNGVLGNCQTSSLTVSNPVVVGDEPTCTGPPISLAVAITVGADHACALLENGTAQCWGLGGFGRLGSGDTTTRPYAGDVCASGNLPCPAKLTQLIAIATGPLAQSTCALTAAGTVRCWGWNAAGELGDGTLENRANPSAVCSAGAWDGATCSGAPPFASAALRACGDVLLSVP